MEEKPHFLANEHAVDVLRAAVRFADKGESFALAVVTDTKGGAVRAPGAMMAIGASGEAVGYLSGGCIDSDVRARARAAIERDLPEQLRYGQGSPFMDIRLPCGGAIDLAILPNPDEGVVRQSVERLDARRPVALKVLPNKLALADNSEPGPHTYSYRPKVHLRIAGRGTEPLTLARIALAGGLSCEIWSPEQSCIDYARGFEGIQVKELTTPADLPNVTDGAECAFVLMFHDKDWEVALLKQALAGEAFYIGAVGSKATHVARCNQLLESGVRSSDLARVRGPIGLVPSMRDASMLAYSILAEIVHVYHAEAEVRP